MTIDELSLVLAVARELLDEWESAMDQIPAEWGVGEDTATPRLRAEWERRLGLIPREECDIHGRDFPVDVTPDRQGGMTVEEYANADPATQLRVLADSGENAKTLGPVTLAALRRAAALLDAASTARAEIEALHRVGKWEGEFRSFVSCVECRNEYADEHKVCSTMEIVNRWRQEQ